MVLPPKYKKCGSDTSHAYLELAQDIWKLEASSCRQENDENKTYNYKKPPNENHTEVNLLCAHVSWPQPFSKY